MGSTRRDARRTTRRCSAGSAPPTAPARAPRSDLAAHVIGNAGLSAAAKAQVAGAFPMTVNVVASPAAAGPLTVSSAYSLSSVSGPTIVTFTDVILEQGGYFVCDGTILSFSCNTLTRNGNTGNPSIADFNILGITRPRPRPRRLPPLRARPRPGPTATARRPASRAAVPQATGRPGNPGNHRHPRRHGCSEPGRDDQDPDGTEQPDQHLLAVRKRWCRRQRRPRRHRSGRRQRRQRRHL